MSYFKPQMLFFTRYWKDSLIHFKGGETMRVKVRSV